MITEDMQKKINDGINNMSPLQQGVIKNFQSLSGQLQESVAHNETLLKDYKDLYNILIVVIDAYKQQGIHELRIHESQVKRLGNLYRIDRRWDEGTKEIVLELLCLYDTVVERPKGEK